MGRENVYQASKGGHLECLRYARENGCPWDEKTCEEAAKAGDLQEIKRLRLEVLDKWSESMLGGMLGRVEQRLKVASWSV